MVRTAVLALLAGAWCVAALGQLAYGAGGPIAVPNLGDASGTPPQNSVCEVTDVLDIPGTLHLADSAPTRIRMMNVRYAGLEAAVLGYEKTKVPLVAFNGSHVGPAGPLDDPGIYLLIPRLSIWLGWPLIRTIDVFFSAMILVSLVIGIVGFWITLETSAGRLAAIFWAMLIAVAAFVAGDVYIVSAAIALAFLPWVLYWMKRTSSPKFPIFLALTGFTIGIAGAFRSNAGTALMLFIVPLLLLDSSITARRRLSLLLLLLVASFLPALVVRSLIHQRNAYLSATCPEYPQFRTAHPFWHSVYIGFGFLTNPYVAAYDDSVAYAKVQAVAPGTLFNSDKYEQILRREVLRLVGAHPKFVLTTLAAKTGVLLFLLILTANFGLLSAAMHPKPLRVELGFWAAIAFSSLPGLLVVPNHIGYMLGFITMSSLYAVSSVDFAFAVGPRKSASEITPLHGNSFNVESKQKEYAFTHERVKS